MQIIGTSLSLTWYFVKSPKENIPSNGPYVYPATVNNDFITLWSLIALNTNITANKTSDINKWTIFLVLICWTTSCFSNSIISEREFSYEGE